MAIFFRPRSFIRYSRVIRAAWSLVMLIRYEAGYFWTSNIAGSAAHGEMMISLRWLVSSAGSEPDVPIGPAMYLMPSAISFWVTVVVLAGLLSSSYQTISTWRPMIPPLLLISSAATTSGEVSVPH